MRHKQLEINRTMIIPFFVVVMLVLMVVMPQEAYSQYEFWYGKNKVQKGFKWQHVETPHFRIYYYTTEERLIKKVAGAAEYAYKKISDYLNVQVKKKKIPLIYYSTKIDFELTNIANIPSIFSPEAFATSNYYRVVVQGEASFEELARTIVHEMGHIFEYEVIGARTRYMSPPLWLIEGFSEFIAGSWNSFTLLTVRDAVLYGRIPKITKYGTFQAPFNNARLLYYDFGHAIYEFLDEKFGRRGIKKILYSMKGGSLFSRGGSNILRVLEYTPKLFNHEFGKYLRKRFEKFATKEDPEDYSYIIGPDFPLGGVFSFQVSPSGEMLAILTVNPKAPDLDIMMISTKDGKVIKNVTPGAIFGSNYDIINFPYEPSGGNAFTWNRKKDQVAFFARKEWKNYLIVMDVLKSKILKKIEMPDIQKATSPKFDPDSNINRIYFTGQEATKAYLYSMDLDTGKVSKLTNGLLFIKAFDLSPERNRIVFSASVASEDYFKLYMGTMDNPGMAKQITFGDYNDITPSFSGDSRYVYYSSDELGSYNINKIDLREKKLFRYTDVKTGNFFPLEIPEEKDHVIMTSFYKGAFTLFKKDVSTPLEERELQFEDVDEELLAKKEEEELKETEIHYKGKYKPLKKLFIESLPPLGVSIGTDGGLWGYSSLNLTDLMGDQNFMLQIYSDYGYRSYSFVYLNQKRRLQLFSHLFSFRQSYYTGYGNIYSRSSYRTLREIYGGEIGIWYPFSRSYRLETTASFYKQKENIDTIYTGSELPYGQYVNGWAVPLRISLVGDTIFYASSYPGPIRGSTFKLSFEKYFKLSPKFIDAYTVEADFRKYLRIDNYSLLAFRLFGFKSGGKNPLLLWTGGNNTIRSVGFRRFTGNNVFLFNAEFRFPLLHQAWSVIGPLGPIRGVFFFDLGGVWFNDQNFRVFREGKGLELEDAIASYGFGVEFFFLGYPMHVEWVWRTNLRRKDYYGVNFWIGFDF